MMSVKRKEAYRYILYWAFIEIRPIQWYFTDFKTWFRPLRAFSYIREVGALSDWFHNLALFSSLEFEGFNEEAFWEQGKYFSGKYPETYSRYENLFNQILNDEKAKNS